MEIEEVTCRSADCFEAVVNEEHALWRGWQLIEGEVWCPLHAPQESRRVRKIHDRELLDHRANEITARETLDKGWYAAWDEFQSDLADFHRATGRHAHKNVRMMTPQQFRDEYRRAGRINVKNAHEAAHSAENAWKEQLRRIL